MPRSLRALGTPLPFPAELAVPVGLNAAVQHYWPADGILACPSFADEGVSGHSETFERRLSADAVGNC